jgi:hypothetical protein
MSISDLSWSDIDSPTSEWHSNVRFSWLRVCIDHFCHQWRILFCWNLKSILIDIDSIVLPNIVDFSANGSQIGSEFASPTRLVENERKHRDFIKSVQKTSLKSGFFMENFRWELVRVIFSLSATLLTFQSIDEHFSDFSVDYFISQFPGSLPSSSTLWLLSLFKWMILINQLVPLCRLYSVTWTDSIANSDTHRHWGRFFQKFSTLIGFKFEKLAIIEEGNFAHRQHLKNAPQKVDFHRNLRWELVMVIVSLFATAQKLQSIDWNFNGFQSTLHLSVSCSSSSSSTL